MSDLRDTPNDEATAADAPAEHRFPCAACGSDLRFDAEAGGLECDHCGHRQDIPDDTDLPAIRERDLDTALRQQLDSDEIEETRVSQCPSCGAQVEFAPQSHAAECPFCATPVVTDTGTHRHIKPRGLIPFGVDEGAARKRMIEWLGRLWFAPDGLQDYARKGRTMAGIYVPYWTIDARTRSRYSGLRGDTHYVTRTVVRNGKTEQRRVAKIRWRPRRGRVRRAFDDVLILASKGLPKSYTDRLAPWDLSALTRYTPEFLAGFRAEGYTLGLEDAFAEARGIMDARIRQDVRADIGGDHQRILSLTTDVDDVTYKHILLPVWLAAYRYKGETYRFVVNGQTGKVQGERPWSAGKIAIAVLIGLIVAAGLAYLYSRAQ